MGSALDLRNQHRDLEAERIAQLKAEAARQQSTVSHILGKPAPQPYTLTSPDVLPQLLEEDPFFQQQSESEPFLPMVPSVPTAHKTVKEYYSLTIRIPKLNWRKASARSYQVAMIVITGLVLVRWVGFETGVFSSKQAAIAPAFALPVPKLEPLVATPVSAATPATPAGATTADARSHLSISKLGINAPIQQVGLTPDGNMDVPSNLQTLGWYNGGPKPGEPGNAVIAGHYGAPKVAGIFRTLDRLAIGDIIEVVDGSRTLKFRVKEVAQYPLANVPLQKLFGASATAHLNLVTCVGAFDGAKYSDRLVVYTDLMR